MPNHDSTSPRSVCTINSIDRPPRLSERQRSALFGILADYVRDEFLDHISEVDERDWSSFQSPVELAFYLAWLTNGACSRIRQYPENGELQPQFNARAGGHDYRLDFAYVADAAGVRVAVEIDGHEFHERTPEQVERRDRRDADLQAAGWTVIHFSARRVLRDPMGCVDDAWGAICDAAYRYRMTVSGAKHA